MSLNVKCSRPLTPEIISFPIIVTQSSESHLQRTKIKGRKHVVQECTTKSIRRLVSAILESDSTQSSTGIKLRLHDQISRADIEVHTADGEGHFRRCRVALNFVDSGSIDICGSRIEGVGNDGRQGFLELDRVHTSSTATGGENLETYQ